MIDFGLDQTVKNEIERAWLLPTSSKIISAYRKIIYETIGEGWQKNLWYTEIEHWLEEWEKLDDPSEPTSDIVGGLKFQGERMIEDIIWEIKFEVGGGDEMAKAHAFGYDI